MKKFVIFSLLMSLSTGLVVYLKSPPEGEQSNKNSTDRPAQLKDFISLKPSSSVFAHVEPTIKEPPSIVVSVVKEKSSQAPPAEGPSPSLPSPSTAKITAEKSSEPQSAQVNTPPQPRKPYVIPSEELAISIATLKSLAAEDPRASYDLSLRYFRGDGVRQDSYEALQWMRDAAERGDRAAQKELGKLYMTGLEEMGSDFREARKWLTIAASAGDKEAKSLLQEVKQGRLLEDLQFEMRRSSYPSAFGEMDSSYRMYWLRGQWRLY
jgi:TPR repeat protein